MTYLETSDHFALNFVHKRLLGAAKTFVTSGFSPTAAGAAFLTSGGATSPVVRRPPPRTLTARPSAASAAGKEIGRQAKFGNGRAPTTIPGFQEPASGNGSCPGFTWVLTNSGQCRNVITGEIRPQTGRAPVFDAGTGAAAPVGDAVMGRYGAALVPGSRIVDRAMCLRGMQLADDGLCYNKSQITNKQRMWPAGRKPLLTGGEMRAITVAATAGRRLERASKRLQKIGLMKKPAPRSRRITSGPTEHHHHS